MALLLREDGTQNEVLPGNGKYFTLEELQTLVGGFIELVYTHDGLLMYIDEEGKQKEKAVNTAATALYRYGMHDPIVGTAIVGTKEELDGPEDDEET